MARRSLVDRVLGLPSARVGRVRIEADLEVPMRDGAVLRADRYTLSREDGAPLVLLRTPYGRKGLWKHLYCVPLARRGYQVVIQSCRGTADSGGGIVPFDERDDGADTVDWLRTQSWFPGRFATFGPSYWGLAQWALATDPPPELAAMTPVLTSSRLVRSLTVDGAFSLETWLGWSATLAAQQERGAGVRAILTARSRRVRRALRHLPVSEADEMATGRPLDWWRAWTEKDGHPFDADAVDWSEAPRRAGVPVLMVTSWYDHFAPWQLADWADLGDGARPRRLVIAAWVHEDAKLLKLYLRESLDWLDAHLRGGDAAMASQAVRYYVTGADRWVDAASWPPPGGQEQRWHLRTTERLDIGAPPADAAASRFIYDPREPAPSIGGPSARRNPQAGQADVEGRSDVICFTSAPLVAPVEIVGTPTARVHLRTSTTHADLVVRLCDVDPSGRSIHVTDGIRRLTPQDNPPDPDGVRDVVVRLWPAGHRFLAGHRMRVQLTGGAFPRFDRNPGTGTSTTATQLMPQEIEVLHDPRHPSFLSLPTQPIVDPASGAV